MSEFERQLPTCRLVATHYGDDLQSVAARELGDANRWPELVWINSLRWPYITTDERVVGPGVILAGDLLKVPSPVGFSAGASNDGQIYERDCRLFRKLLTADESGDLDVAAGVDNLKQQLEHRVITPRGQARRNPDYGCLIWRLVGKVNGPAAGLMGAEYVKAALVADYRVASVDFSSAEVIGDAVRIQARAVAIDGGVVDVAGSST